jgi:GntR family transcriptional regulator
LAYHEQTTHIEDAQSGNAGVSHSLRMPLYHQIYLVLRQRILDGDLRFDDQLAGELDLVGEYSVSRITARRALEELAADGLVVKSRTKGTRVQYRPERPSVESSSEGLLQNLLPMGKKNTVSLEDFQYLSANEEVAQAMNITIGDIVQKAVRIRHFKSGPFSILITHVPQDVGRNFHMQDLKKMPLLQLLERAGIVLEEANQSISATLAGAKLARQMKTDVGVILVDVRRIVSGNQGRPVEYTRAIYRPDKFRYQMTMSRIEGEEANQWSSIERVES